MEISSRYRVNVSTSTKGVHTFDCTVEMTADGQANAALAEGEIQKLVLAESDALVAELDKRYPPPKE